MTKFQAVQKVDVGLKDLTIAVVDQGDDVNSHNHHLKLQHPYLDTIKFPRILESQ